MTINVSNCKCRCIRRLDTHTLICIIHTTSVRKSYLSQKKLLCSTVFLADVPSVTKNIKTTRGKARFARLPLDPLIGPRLKTVV